jgi:hypothetical protein
VADIGLPPHDAAIAGAEFPGGDAAGMSPVQLGMPCDEELPAKAFSSNAGGVAVFVPIPLAATLPRITSAWLLLRPGVMTGPVALL